MEQVRQEFMEFKEKMEAFHLPRTNELPNVELYMDQVLSVLNSSLSALEIDKSEDFITSSMINNYVKQGLITPPKNKKYDKIQICFLIVICVLKKVYAIGEIKTLLLTSAQGKSHDELRVAYHSFCECIERVLHSEPISAIDWEEELFLPYGNALALSVGMKIFEQKIVALKRGLIVEAQEPQ
ncbi:MAG: DUF1836 domain-containing protein [Clostridia bacterium]|nr:DUF1836 domain-containing protein [Clostridia bacterium]